MARYWLEVDKRVQLAGLTNEQVQVAWMQENDLRNTTANFRTGLICWQMLSPMLLSS